jgi:phage shock protein C
MDNPGNSSHLTTGDIMEQTMKRVTRSSENRIIAGVCGGVAEYAGWDPVTTRILYVALTILSFGFGGILLYLAAWIVLPADDEVDMREIGDIHSMKGRRVIGILLIVIGAIAFLPAHLPWFWGLPHRAIGPFLLIAAGIILLCKPEKSKIINSSQMADAKFEEIKSESEPMEEKNPTTKARRLVRSRINRKIAGICGGIGDYFQVDPTLVRLLWIAAIFALGTGLLLYLVLWIVMPLEAEM